MPESELELMYRQPGLPEHQNITDVLDEIIIELRKQQDRILDLEEIIEKLYLEID